MAQGMQSGDLRAGDEEDQESLPEDGSRPAYEAEDVEQTLPVDHPTTDDRLDEHEEYDEGLDGAAEAEDPEHRIHGRPPRGEDRPK